MDARRLPDLADQAGLDRYRADPPRWRPAVAELASSLGLGDVELRDLGGGCLVVAAGDAHVLKLAPPVFGDEIEVERRVLPRVAGRLPVPTPRLLASGRLDGWSYLLLDRLPGRTLYDAWPGVDGADRARVLRALGRAIAALHAIEPPAEGPTWAEFLGRQSGLCLRRQAAWGVPAEVVALIGPLLDRARLGDVSRTPLLHADLTGQNVLADERLELRGLVDFADAQVGHPLYELVTPGLLLAGGRPGLLAALLEGYGWSGADARVGLAACAALHRFNPLTRYFGGAVRWPATVEDLVDGLFPV